jgi:hypothetical protein
MLRWYSPRGARRGLRLAGVVALLWMLWALGYVQGVTKSAFETASRMDSANRTVIEPSVRRLDI